MISFNEVKEKIEEMGYYATDELLYDTYNSLLLFHSSKVEPGQDIVVMCLEGPPGAGKTEFAKTYTKLANELFKNVELVDYQCDITTGKTELFEDINISAAIRQDADHVIISGKLIEAIKKVNEGKKVVLFIDEYDKAREETDAFFLQLAQSGKINSTQHGDLEIKEEYKNNLQIILCKNDMREELSGPLSRRIRITRLDYMLPLIFHKLATRLLVEERKPPVSEGLINLVSLMYEKAYANREMLYNRLPSCSEMLIAIEDADRMLKMANAPQNVIYHILIKNMFKSPDDIITFESSLDRVANEKESTLSALVKGMKTSTENSEEEIDFNSLIAEKVFVDEGKKLIQKRQELQDLIDEYKNKFLIMEQTRKKMIEEEKRKILLENGKLVSTTNVPDVIKNFEDEAAYIKRGFNIFELSDGNWVDIAKIQIPELSHHLFISKLIEYAGSLGIQIYENGILLQENEEQKIIVINDLDDNHHPRYRIMSSHPVIPSIYLLDVENFISFALDVCNSQNEISKQIFDQQSKNKTEPLALKGTYFIDSLVYNDSNLDFETVKENVYNIEVSGDIQNLESLKNITQNLSCSDINHALQISNEIMNGKRKVKVYE